MKQTGSPLWPHGQAVKTSPFHGGNPGSIPGGVTRINSQTYRFASFFCKFFNENLMRLSLYLIL